MEHRIHASPLPSFGELLCTLVQPSLSCLQTNGNASLFERNILSDHACNCTSGQEGKRVSASVIPCEYMLSRRTRDCADMWSTDGSDTFSTCPKENMKILGTIRKKSRLLFLKRCGYLNSITRNASGKALRHLSKQQVRSLTSAHITLEARQLLSNVECLGGWRNRICSNSIYPQDVTRSQHSRAAIVITDLS